MGASGALWHKRCNNQGDVTMFVQRKNTGNHQNELLTLWHKMWQGLWNYHTIPERVSHEPTHSVPPENCISSTASDCWNWLGSFAMRQCKLTCDSWFGCFKLYLFQVFHFDAHWANSSQSLTSHLQTGLLDSIRILQIDEVPLVFHARHSCVAKRYVYKICEGFASPFETRFYWSLGKRKLNILEMQKAAQLMIGEHNFHGFSKYEDGDVRTPVKIMHSLRIVREDEFSAKLQIIAECNRFLYRMMRKIVGTLVEVGLGRLSAEEFSEILKRAEYSKKVVTAPARGLVLQTVFYKDRFR